MTQQLREIGIRLSTLREIMELKPDKMAHKLEMSTEEYLAYERGERDFSFSFLQNAADILGVDVLDIISGESPKLNICSIVRKDGGLTISRRASYNYKHLAFTFRNKLAEPFMVTVEPSALEEKPVLHNHDGQEFNYMVSGKMEFHIGDMTYVMEEGDSLYFDASVPHAMRALNGNPAIFIAVVIKSPQK